MGGRLRPRLRLAAILAITATAVTVGPAVGSALASHGRFFNVSWQKVSGDHVQFTAKAAFRRSGYSGSASDGLPAPGDVIAEDVGDTELLFGDGDSTGELNFLVTSIDPANDVLFGIALDPASPTGDHDTLIDHTYANDGPWTASMGGCCTIGSLNNNAGGFYSATSLVDLANDDESPVSTAPPIVGVGDTGVQHFTITASDPDSNTLRFRLATPEEACDGQPCDANPPGLTIDPATGEVTWDTTGLASGLWYSSIVVEEVDGAANVISTTQLTYLINVSNAPPTNNPPAFVSPTPADGSEFTVNVGSPLSISLKATDPDSGDTVSITASGVPGGATFTPTDGNPATATFSWTPALADVGDYVVSFSAQDDNGASAPFRSITIHVVNGEDTTAPTIDIVRPADGAVYNVDQIVTASYSCTDEPGGSGVATCSGPVADGDMIDTSTPGSFSFTVTTTDNAGNTRSETVHYTVREPPNGGPCSRPGAITGSGTITGTPGDDIICGSAGPDQIDGLGGNDVIYGKGGDDTIRGGAGNDRVLGGGGNDDIRGDRGSDLLSGGAGNDHLHGDGGHNDRMYGQDGNDQLFGSRFNNRMWGGAGDDYVIGGDGRDLELGGTGHDRLFGEGGDDVLHGNEDNDQLHGGPGSDWLIGDTGPDVVLGDKGNDYLGLHDGAPGDYGNGGRGRDRARKDRGDTTFKVEQVTVVP